MSKLCEISTIDVDVLAGYSPIPSEVAEKCSDCIFNALRQAPVVVNKEALRTTQMLGEQAQSTEVIKYYRMRPDEHTGLFDVEEDIFDQYMVGETVVGEVAKSGRRAPLRCPLANLAQLEIVV